MDFPKESIEKAREIAKIYRQRSVSRLEQAANLYDGHFLELSYGFGEDIKQGCCGRYLHEIKRETECFTKATVDYLVARETGLKPRFYWITQMKDVKEGEDPEDKGTLEHAFITVETAKRYRHVIDRQMGVFGKVRFHPEDHKIEIYDRKNNILTLRTYALLTELSEKEILKKIEKDRSREGGRLVLSAPQKVYLDGSAVFLVYNPNNQTITSRVQNERIGDSIEPYKKATITELSTRVNFNGSFDFDNGEFSCFNAVGIGWTEHNVPQTRINYSARNAKSLFGIWQEIMKTRGRKSDVGNLSGDKLTAELEDSGLRRFLLEPNSPAEEVVIKTRLESALQRVQEEKNRRIKDFLEECKKHEISYKVFLRDTRYTLAQDKLRTKENPRGFVFSYEDHERLLEEEFQRYEEEFAYLNKFVVEKAKIRAKFKKGSFYHTFRSTNAQVERTTKNIRLFEDLCRTRQDKYKLSFDLFADIILFNKQFNLEKQTVLELEQGLTQKDLLNGAEDRLFHSLIRANLHKRSLYLASFKKGLQKILDQTQN